VEETIETASTFEEPAVAPAPVIATAPPALPSRIKAAVAAIEAHQPEPQIEREQEQKPDRPAMMHDTQPKTDTKTNSPLLPSSGLSGFADHEHDHEHEHDGEEDLHDAYEETFAVPGMAL